MKRIAVVGLVVLLGALSGCYLVDPIPEPLDLILTSTPDSGYPPLAVTLRAVGPVGGQYTFTVEGRTFQQPTGTLNVTVKALPCEATVEWIDGTNTLENSVTIGLENEGPVPGQLVLNGIENLWTIHPRWKYTVTFPDAFDREGGPVTLVDVRVEHTGQGEPNTVFCPPYSGANPPKPDVYHVRTGTGTTLNAFVFYSIWNGRVDGSVLVYSAWKDTRPYEVGDKANWNGKAYECKKACTDKEPPLPGSNKWWLLIGDVHYGSGLPRTPPGRGEDGYPGTCVHGSPGWPTEFIPGDMTDITTTWEDEEGARTIDCQSVPTMPYPGC